MTFRSKLFKLLIYTFLFYKFRKVTDRECVKVT